MAALTTTNFPNKQVQREDDFATVPHCNVQTSEERAEDLKRMEFLRKAEQLKKLSEKHEKMKNLNINNKRNGFQDCFGVLEELDNKLQNELKTEIMKVQQQLLKIRNGVNRFQRQLTDVKPSPDLIEKLKNIMTEVENSINIFKEDQHQSFEELLKEERTCWQEICAFEKKIDTWSVVEKADLKLSSAPLAKVCMARNHKEKLPPEVTALETFLQQTGGKQGGWDQYDHQSFLKIWTKHCGKASYRKEAQLYLPGRTVEEIKLHEEWYLQLGYLQEKKKVAIHRWRADQQRQKEEWLQRQEQAEDAEQREKASAAETQQCKLEEERREAAARLQAWKTQRTLQLEQEKEQRLKEDVLQRKKAKEEQRRQMEVKLAVESHIQQKKEEEKLRLLERESQERVEMEEKKRFAAIHIKYFQERDLRKLETKLIDKQTKEEEELERQKRLAKIKEKVEVNISRDPARLWKPTKGWEERTKEIGPTGGGPVYQIFHRAVPSWRQGL